MEKVAVERSVWIDAPPEKVWRAVTERAQLDQWYATYYRWEIPALKVGETVKFYNKDNHADFLLATIEVLDVPREFTICWQPDKTYPAMALVTSFLLEAESGGTRATIRESGYESLPDDVRQQWIDSIGEGYGMGVENLKALVEGRSLPY